MIGKKSLLLFSIFLFLSGCFQVYNDESDLRTVPTTNNPHIIPNHGSPFLAPAGGSSELR